LRLVERADDEPDTDGEELHLGERDPDVAGDHESLVEDAVEHVDQPGGALTSQRELVSQARGPHAPSGERQPVYASIVLASAATFRSRTSAAWTAVAGVFGSSRSICPQPARALSGVR